MANTNGQNQFYREVDRYRHQSGCMSLGMIVLFVVIGLVLIAWFLYSRGYF